jgi:hypothetical protein
MANALARVAMLLLAVAFPDRPNQDEKEITVTVQCQLTVFGHRFPECDITAAIGVEQGRRSNAGAHRGDDEVGRTDPKMIRAAATTPQDCSGSARLPGHGKHVWCHDGEEPGNGGHRDRGVPEGNP